MNLPSLFSHTETTPTEALFFAVHIAEKYVESALWRVREDKVEIVVQSGQEPWNNEENCVAAVDRSLQELGKEAESVKKTLFALRSDWVNNNGILITKKNLFHKITTELSLEPVGFVVTTEALVQYLTQTSSPQLSMFLIEFTDQHLLVSVIQHGQIIKTEKVGRSGESASDLVEAFSHFTEKVFPSKFLLFSSFLLPEELSEAQQQLITFDWASKYPFLHPPIIEVFQSTNILETVVQSGGHAVAESKGLLKAAPIIPAATEVIGNVAPMKAEAAAANFGFKEVSADTAAIEESNVQAVSHLPAFSHPQHSQVAEKLPTISDYTPSENPVLPRKHKHHRHTPFILLGMLGGVAVLILATFLAAQQLMKAKIEMALNTKTVAKDISLILDPNVAQSDPQKLLLKAELVTKEESNQKTANTTGVKLIGDKAKGKVTIFNLTNNLKTFSAGTVLTTGTLKFTLDQSVTVASASSSQDSSTNAVVIKPSTSDVSVTAAQIGTDSNVDKNTDFEIESFPKTTYTARTNDGFAGGTSREIQAVSKEDRDKLLASLKKELLDKAAQEFKTQSGAGRFITPTGKVKVLKSDFSADVGKETNTLTLNMKIQVDGLAYQLADLKPLASQVLGSSVPAGYQLSQADPEILSSPSQSASGSSQTILQANISSVAVPILRIDEWKAQVAGKPVKSAEDTLVREKEIKSVQITLTPPFFAFFFHNLPKKTANIDIHVN